MKKILIVDVGISVNDVLLHQTEGPEFKGIDVVLVSVADLSKTDMLMPVPVATQPNKVIEIAAQPVLDVPVVLHQKKPYQRSTNKYQNKRKHRRH